VTTGDGEKLDPFRAWTVMMTGEKPGGHGERCVAVGTLDMALWDAAAKIAHMPLDRFLADRLGRNVTTRRVRVYGALATRTRTTTSRHSPTRYGNLSTSASPT
jgi:L-alanine-DL-glutamate epimerase-like enolase superfamily enzyme